MMICGKACFWCADEGEEGDGLLLTRADESIEKRKRRINQLLQEMPAVLSCRGEGGSCCCQSQSKSGRAASPSKGAAPADTLPTKTTYLLVSASHTITALVLLPDDMWCIAHRVSCTVFKNGSEISSALLPHR